MSQNIQISNFTNIRPVGAELFHGNRRTDMTKLTARFHSSANAPKKTNITTYITCMFLKHSLSRQPVAINLQAIVSCTHI